jgi:dolichol-phosphate mannosyltransferase
VLPPGLLEEVRSEGYAFQVELTRAVYRRGGRITEIPIAFVDRTRGRSKMSRRIAFEALWRVAGWGISDRVRRRRR